MEEKFNEQESLRLITEMINQARNNFRKGAGNSQLFWGYTIATLALFNYVLLALFESPVAYSVWILTVPFFIIMYFYQRKNVLVKSHIDTVVSNVWIAFFISALVMVVSVYGLAWGLRDYVLFLLINPIILVMCGLSSFVTGMACRFKPYIYGGYCFWVGTIVCAFLPLLVHKQGVQFLVAAICMIFGFVIPAHIANSKAKEDDV